jgi:hypothetical protein
VLYQLFSIALAAKHAGNVPFLHRSVLERRVIAAQRAFQGSVAHLLLPALLLSVCVKIMPEIKVILGLS